MDSDRQLAAAALEKKRLGQKPTRDESAALRRLQRETDERSRLEHFRAVRQKEWREWSGRQAKVIAEQAARYGLPIGGPTIDLTQLAPALHDFLAANARRLSAGEDEDDASLARFASPAQERKRQLECRKLELQLARDEGRVIDRPIIHDALSRVGLQLRKAGEALRRQFGPAAQKILNDALDNCQRETTRLLDPHGDDASDSGPN
jgi:hypothetical protein